MKMLSIAFVAINFSWSVMAQDEKIPWHYELDGEAGKQADSIHNVFMTFHYRKILKKHKVKMSCAKCTSAFMDVVISVQHDGTIGEFDVLNSKQCGGELGGFIQADFFSVLLETTFPESLRNLTFIYRLGTSLSC